MTDPHHGGGNHGFDIRAAAHAAMLANGFAPDFPAAALQQVSALADTPPLPNAADVRDLRALLWSSIDNDDTKDLDQIEVVELLPNGDTHVMVAIADVDALVAKGSPCDAHASENTTSVYTGVTTFAMLPERLSTDLTSLREGVDRSAIVVSFIAAGDGTTREHDVYRALVRNRGQLAYNAVGAWLEGTGPAPSKIAANAELGAQLRAQDAVARAIRQQRAKAGALELATIEATPVTTNGRVVDLEVTRESRARDLIEDFMIAANIAAAEFLQTSNRSSIRRVVKTPERWDRIVALAHSLGESLPATPDAVALNAVLTHRKQIDPEHFPDLSLAVVKLLGPGQYALEKPGEVSDGHFGLAVHDYTHSTAPNRRFADLVMQRLLKATLAGTPAAYADPELDTIAQHCTQKENDARKVERLLRKIAAAALLSDRIGQTFDAIVTGASEKGTYVRLLAPPVEGRVVRGAEGLDVGDKTRVKLLAADERKGWIDFARLNGHSA